MNKIILAAVGRVKEKHFADAVAEYIKRLQPFVQLKVEELAPEPFGKSNRNVALEKEMARFQKFIDRNEEYLVVRLDESGKELSSEQFSKWLEDETQPIIFLLGGAQGFTEDFKKKYPNTLSLSRMTLPHEMARVVFLEQLYRAVAITRGKEYHY